MIYNFSTTDFEGPLDLLLHLVKESKLDIYEINIKSIIDQYLDFIHSLKENNIDVASEYLVMSSELIHLKSKLLINRRDEDNNTEDEYSFNSEEDLRNRLVEYEKYKQITKNFLELEEKRNEVYTKLPENLKEYMPDNKLTPGIINVDDLFKAYMSFINTQKLSQPLSTKITKKNISIEDRIKDIRNILNTKNKINFIELLKDMSKQNIVVTFLSLLEMCKGDEIILKQEDSFSPIIIERRV